MGGAKPREPASGRMRLVPERFAGFCRRGSRSVAVRRHPGRAGRMFQLGGLGGRLKGIWSRGFDGLGFRFRRVMIPAERVEGRMGFRRIVVRWRARIGGELAFGFEPDRKIMSVWAVAVGPDIMGATGDFLVGGRVCFHGGGNLQEWAVDSWEPVVDLFSGHRTGYCLPVRLRLIFCPQSTQQIDDQDDQQQQAKPAADGRTANIKTAAAKQEEKKNDEEQGIHG